MPKVNTLFSYFKKTPSKPAQGDKESCLKPKQENQKSPKCKSPQAKSKGAGENGSNTKDETFSVGDLVWAKLEGYPWWPSLVCNHPTQQIHRKVTKDPQVHVQFFDKPPSRAWIKEKFVKPYKGSDCPEFKRGGQFYTANPQCRSGTEEADEALPLSVKERLKLVVDHESSEDEEEEDQEIEQMEFDADIFDDEADDDADNSKENHEEKEQEQKKTPSKSPKKGSRPPRSCKKPKVKRRKVESVSDEESGDEYKPESEASSDDQASSGVDEDEVSDISESEPESPVKKSKKRKRNEPANTPKPSSKVMKALSNLATPGQTEQPNKEKFTPTVGNKTKSKLAAFSAPETSVDATDSERSFPHLQHDFLKPDKIRDGERRKPDDPEYDPRTVYLPDHFLQKQTPAMRQWWEIKAKHYDAVLFFKMGKFYELFHMDAVIAVNELGLIYMKGEHAHSGFPEIAYSRYADQLIQKGYRVARIEQTETPDMMGERVKKMSRPTKFDKVVKREVCRITTKGTKVYSFIDGDTTDAQNAYLLALCEKESSEAAGCESSYGVCFVDTSIGKFHLGQFDDDRHCSRLRTLLSHYPPVQILYEKGKVSEKTQQILNTNLLSSLKDSLHSGSEFWESGKTLKFLSEGDYFVDETSKNFSWPAELKQFISESDSLGQTAVDDKELAVRSLGAITWYLCDCLLDQELLSMKNFEVYEPLDGATSPDTSAVTPAFITSRKHMVLDGVTLANLDIVQNSSTGTTEGTLLERLDQCSTPFGKRLLKQWLCAPLCNPGGINDRLNAVEDLMNQQELVKEATDTMKKLPDLERLLSKIHTLGSKSRSVNHPESRAIYFEDVTYSKRKIEDLLAAVGGYKLAKKMISKLKDSVSDLKSKLLKQCISLTEDGGHFPDLSEELDFFDQAFDHRKAQQAGVIDPNEGVDQDYDDAVSDIKRHKGELESYLQEQKKVLSNRNLCYWGTGKNRYQLEVPESSCRNIPHHYNLMSSKKGAKRYRTTEIESMLAALTDAEDRRDAALRDIMRRIFHQFDTSYTKWESAAQCLSVLDVLISMSQFSQSGDGEMCRPQIELPESNTQPFIEIRGARHPCISRTFSGGDFIPNDTVVGIKDENDMETDATDEEADKSRVVLVTGPNMGGKSTLMRQVGTVLVLAQLGCYVPAELCRFTPVDRVFTRLGATDRIMSGESTFFVELSETSAILQHATPHSLVLLDELGRGTATFDGTAIACAVVRELSERIRCRTLFSTHYHSLVEEFSHDPNIRLGHMACMVENENDEDPSQETITFLYKFVKGACPKSYGFNAARLADLPEEVIQVAIKKAKDFEHTMEQVKSFSTLYHHQGDLQQLQHHQQAIRV